MKDLKHLTYFENLLLEANNELVRQAQDAGRFAVGQVCSLIPEVLMNVPGCFSVRLRAPHLGSMEIGTYYMTSMSCEYCRAVLELAEDQPKQGCFGSEQRTRTSRSPDPLPWSYPERGRRQNFRIQQNAEEMACRLLGIPTKCH